MTLRSALLTTLLSITVLCHGQYNRTLNWTFGDSVLVNFSGSTPTTSTSIINSWEGMSTMSDLSGNLLFYTNGEKVYNSSHEIMENGDSLFSRVSATNTGLAVPKPGSDSLYYIFTVGARMGIESGGYSGVGYSIVDMSRDSGFGEVILKNEKLFPISTEKLCATRHINGVDYWIMTHDWDSDIFRAYLLTEGGITDSVLSKVGVVHRRDGPITTFNPGAETAAGGMRFSPSGCKLGLILPYQGDTLELFNFDKATGYVFDTKTIYVGGGDRLRGICFSPDNSKVYVSTYKFVIQYDLTLWDQSEISGSKKYAASHEPSNHGFYRMQIGPNGKIYIVRKRVGVKCSYLSAFDSPNLGWWGSDFVDTSFVFDSGFDNSLALPNFVSSFLLQDTILTEACYHYCPSLDLGKDTTICAGSLFEISVDLPDGTFNWNTDSQSKIIQINEQGEYILEYKYYFCETQIDTIIVYVIDKPSISIISDSCLYLGVQIDISLTNLDSFYVIWNNGISGPNITIQQEGTFVVNMTNSSCEFSDSIHIEICSGPIEFPNVFTPNGDGINDNFIPIVNKGVQRPKLSIINRWGQQIYSTTDLIRGWDGTIGENPYPAGVYFWIIQFEDKNGISMSLHGNVTLIH
ncbi:gliding motility-associated C-terminal domain-containing protein [Crocinitomix catalasitica]|nr:gliding motility-associated C-terminal domain-containing protein [Crocinitomix catalasitica]